MSPDANQLSPRERIQRATNALNQPVVCPDCGSTWFYEVTFNQYSKSVYSNSPGGDLKIISVMPQQLRICPCGRPITPNLGGVRGGRTPNAEMSSFFEALTGAVGYRNDVAEGKKAVQKLVDTFATREDVETVKKELGANGTGDDALKAEIADLKARLEALEAAVTNVALGEVQPTDAPAKPKKGGKA